MCCVFHHYNANPSLKIPGVSIVDSTERKVVSAADLGPSKLCKKNFILIPKV